MFGGEIMKDNKLIIIVVFLLLLVGGYFLLSGNGSESTTTTTVTESADDKTEEAMEDEAVVVEDEAMMEDEEKMTEDDKMEESNVKTFEVGGGEFYFNPNEITVTEGDTVKIVFTNEGGTHDWVIDEFNTRTPITQTGETAEIEFVADAAGTFEYYCSVGNHRAQGMFGKLIVEPK